MLLAQEDQKDKLAANLVVLEDNHLLTVAQLWQEAETVGQDPALRPPIPAVLAQAEMVALEVHTQSTVAVVVLVDIQAMAALAATIAPRPPQDPEAAVVVVVPAEVLEAAVARASWEKGLVDLEGQLTFVVEGVLEEPAPEMDNPEA